MTIWALADLHLAFRTPSKDMSVFGPSWKDYAEKIESNWRAYIGQDDLVLLPGDISWASSLESAKMDLDWIHKLPGTKVLIKGNHDYWWASNAKMQQALPSSIHFIHNNSFTWQDVTIGGSRLWDSQEYSFCNFIHFQENPKAQKDPHIPSSEENERIFLRELDRLKTSLLHLDPKASFRIALTHYPPIGAELLPSRASQLLQQFHVDVCLFGHLHSVRENALPFGSLQGTKYVLTSADYLDFIPYKVR